MTIHDPAAYERAIARNIKNNARIGGNKRWKEELGEDAVRAEAFLYGTGEFADTPVDEDGNVTDWENNHAVEPNPLRRGCFANDFIYKMYENLLEWGRLTEKQTAAVIRFIDRREENLARRKEEHAAKAATAKHIGTVGERRKFEVEVKKIFGFDGQWGTTYIVIMEDDAENVVVYKGAAHLAKEGETVEFMAKVKAHDERDGIAQTIVQRPTKINVTKEVE